MTTIKLIAIVGCMVTQLKVYRREKWTVVELKGRVDAFNDRRLTDALDQVVQAGTQWIALDLSHAEFLSLQMMRSMAAMNRLMGQRQGEVVVVNPSHPVRRQIEIFLGIKVFQIYRSFEELDLCQHYQPRAEFLPSEQASLSL